MIFKKINYRKIYESFIWISVVIAIIAGFFLYKYGRVSWRTLNSNSYIPTEYIIRFILSVITVLFSFHIVLYISMKAGKKLDRFKDLVVIVLIPFIMNFVFFTSFINLLVVIGKVHSLRYIINLCYLNQLAFIICIFQFIHKYILERNKSIIQNILYNLLMIFIPVVFMSAVMLYISSSNIRLNLFYILASIVVSTYCAVFVPFQIHKLIIGSKIKI